MILNCPCELLMLLRTSCWVWGKQYLRNFVLFIGMKESVPPSSPTTTNQYSPSPSIQKRVRMSEGDVSRVLNSTPPLPPISGKGRQSPEGRNLIIHYFPWSCFYSNIVYCFPSFFFSNYMNSFLSRHLSDLLDVLPWILCRCQI